MKYEVVKFFFSFFVRRWLLSLLCRISKIDRNELPTERTLRQLKGLFYTSVSDTYMENLTERVIPLIGLEFEVEKDIYIVKVVVSPCK